MTSREYILYVLCTLEMKLKMMKWKNGKRDGAVAVVYCVGWFWGWQKCEILKKPHEIYLYRNLWHFTSAAVAVATAAADG